MEAGDWREALSAVSKSKAKPWEEWEIPRQAGDAWKADAASTHARLRAAIADDDVGEKSQKTLAQLNRLLGRAYTFATSPADAIDPWPNPEAIAIHGKWWDARIARQKEIDASIAAKAESEYLYDKPYIDKDRVRVAGPFMAAEPRRVCRRPQLLRGWGYGNEEDLEQIFT